MGPGNSFGEHRGGANVSKARKHRCVCNSGFFTGVKLQSVMRRGCGRYRQGTGDVQATGFRASLEEYRGRERNRTRFVSLASSASLALFARNRRVTVPLAGSLLSFHRSRKRVCFIFILGHRETYIPSIPSPFLPSLENRCPSTANSNHDKRDASLLLPFQTPSIAFDRVEIEGNDRLSFFLAVELFTSD